MRCDRPTAPFADAMINVRRNSHVGRNNRKAGSWIGKARSMTTPSRARKRAIVEAAMPEVGEIADAIHDASEAWLTMAGVAAYIAASEHSGTPGEQRQLAAVMFHTARLKFGGVKYDGQLIDKATIEELDDMWCKFFKVDRKKLPKR